MDNQFPKSCIRTAMTLAVSTEFISVLLYKTIADVYGIDAAIKAANHIVNTDLISEAEGAASAAAAAAAAAADSDHESVSFYGALNVAYGSVDPNHVHIFQEVIRKLNPDLELISTALPTTRAVIAAKDFIKHYTAASRLLTSDAIKILPPPLDLQAVKEMLEAFKSRKANRWLEPNEAFEIIRSHMFLTPSKECKARAETLYLVDTILNPRYLQDGVSWKQSWENPLLFDLYGIPGGMKTASYGTTGKNKSKKIIKRVFTVNTQVLSGASDLGHLALVSYRRPSPLARGSIQFLPAIKECFNPNVGTEEQALRPETADAIVAEIEAAESAKKVVESGGKMMTEDYDLHQLKAETDAIFAEIEAKKDVYEAAMKVETDGMTEEQAETANALCYAEVGMAGSAKKVVESGGKMITEEYDLRQLKAETDAIFAEVKVKKDASEAAIKE